jgi:hypothetical protein
MHNQGKLQSSGGVLADDSLRNVYHKSKHFREIFEDRNKAISRKQEAADFFSGHDNSLLPRRWKELLRQAKIKHTRTVQKYLQSP